MSRYVVVGDDASSREEGTKVDDWPLYGRDIPSCGLQVAEIIEEAALLVERELSKDSIALTIETEPDLPLVRGDRIQLQQVLVNLIVNAGQAMSEQHGLRIIMVRTGRTESGARGGRLLIW